LFRRCKEQLGQSPSDYLRDARLRRAHALLERGAGSVTEIACACGFDNLSVFARAFRQRYAMAPSAVARGERGQRGIV
jgi:transcriptional regulator GlxA family with amidase domain